METTNQTYKYIVIGTGPGGGPVARELAKAGRSVLMVERGAYRSASPLDCGSMIAALFRRISA
jgi:choline dehydrogenase